MRDCIGLERRQIKFSAEHSPQFFTQPIISDFLFGNRDGTTLEKCLVDVKELDTLEEWTDDLWRHWLKSWLSEAPHASVLGKPSKALSRKLKEEEKARVEARRKELGDDGLKQLAKKLADAQKQNDREIPQDILAKFKVPSTDSIHFVETTTARSGAARNMGHLENPIQKIIDDEKSNLPLFLHFEHIESSFAHISILVSTETVPIQLRPLLAIYMEIFFSSPMLRNGNRIEFEQVIKELDRDTVGYNFESARNLGNAEALVLKFQVEIDKYATAVQWIKELTFSSLLDLERISTTLIRLLAEIPDEKRSGSSMKDAVNEMIIASPASTIRARSTLVQTVFLKHVRRLLQDDPEAVIDQLDVIRKELWQPCNLRVLVVANVEKLQHAVSTWSTLTDGLDNEKAITPLESRLYRLSELGKSPGDTAYIIPLPTIDSSFGMASAKGPFSYEDPRVPALTVAVSYLNAVEGPLWTAVRGTGLAYGTSIRQYRESGQVALSIYRSPDAYKAYEASKDIVAAYATGKTPIDELALEGAISSIVLDFANAEPTAPNAAEVSFMRQVVRGLDKDYPKNMLEKVRKVTVDEVQAVMRDVIMPIFDAKTSILVVTCAPIMQENIVHGFEGLGLKPQVKTLADFQDEHGLKEEEGDEEDVDDDDDEENDNEETDGDEEGANDKDEL